LERRIAETKASYQTTESAARPARTMTARRPAAAVAPRLDEETEET